MKLGGYPVKRIDKFADLDPSAICYWKNDDRWMIYFPHHGAGNLSQHTVVENGDGTITVTPSILSEDGNPEHTIHGYLTNGQWRDV